METHVETLACNIDINVPNGFTLTGEYRPLRIDDMFVADSGAVMRSGSYCTAGRCFPIVRKVWEPEPWMTPWLYFYKTPGGHWGASTRCPRKSGSGFVCNLGEPNARAEYLAAMCGHPGSFTPPPDCLLIQINSNRTYTVIE